MMIDVNIAIFILRIYLLPLSCDVVIWATHGNIHPCLHASPKNLASFTSDALSHMLDHLDPFPEVFIYLQVQLENIK